MKFKNQEYLVDELDAFYNYCVKKLILNILGLWSYHQMIKMQKNILNLLMN